jgi:ribose/xylose/arabinose/galactoside ABC-type transport system permease subunit
MNTTLPIITVQTPAIDSRPRWLRTSPRYAAGPLACLVLWVVMTAISPGFLTYSNFVNILSQGGFLFVLALGQMLVIVTGGFDISVGAISALSSLVIATTVGPLGEFGAIVAGVGVGFLIGMVNGYLVACHRLQPIVVTLATALIVRGAATAISDGADALPLPPGTVLQNLGYSTFMGIPSLIWIAVPIALLAWLITKRLPLGRWFYMLGSNSEAAALVGVPVRRAGIMAYGLCGAFAGIAAVFLLARSGTAVVIDGAGMELQSIAACVIGGIALRGGTGKPWQVFIGALFVQASFNGLNLLGASPFVSEIVLGMVIISAGAIDYFVRRINQS